jgi:DNA-directed RNA polymerase subunit N (RpoN/RPB10)
VQGVLVACSHSTLGSRMTCRWRGRVALLRLRELLRRSIVAVGLLDRLTETSGVSRHGCRRILLITRVHALSEVIRRDDQQLKSFLTELLRL